MPSPKAPKGPMDPKLMTQHRWYMVPPPMPPAPPGGPGAGAKPPRAEVRISSKDIPQPARSMVIQKMLMGR